MQQCSNLAHKTHEPTGIGNISARLIVYIANRPPLDKYRNLTGVHPLYPGDIDFIGKATGNHWRKIFNCFAKLVFELNTYQYNCWQDLRDQRLLTSSSQQLISFSPYQEKNQSFMKPNQIHIISGKTFFKQASGDIKVEWLDEYFAVNYAKRLIVSPYFDYRQLSNLRIAQLARLIKNLGYD